MWLYSPWVWWDYLQSGAYCFAQKEYSYSSLFSFFIYKIWSNWLENDSLIKPFTFLTLFQTIGERERGYGLRNLMINSVLTLMDWTLQVSYMILQRVSPVTHSVGNCVKRVVVIVSSVIFFKSPVSAINSLGNLFAWSLVGKEGQNCLILVLFYYIPSLLVIEKLLYWTWCRHWNCSYWSLLVFTSEAH